MGRLYKAAERCLPPGFQASRELAGALYCALLFACVHTIGFVVEYMLAHDGMYTNVGTHRVERTDVDFAAFGSMLTAGRICVVIALALIVWMACKYVSYHYTGGTRCIYTMKRLGSRGEFYRRCFTLPLAGLALLIAGWMLLTLLLGALYVWATPERWLAPDAWEQVFRNVLFFL